MLHFLPMAPEWETVIGMDFGMGMGLGAAYCTSTGSASGAASPPFANVPYPPAHLFGLPATDTLSIDDLLDFSNHDLFPSSTSTANTTVDNHSFAPPAEPSSVTGSCPISTETISSHCSSIDLYIPAHEEAAELEWLSKFVEDSFSDVPHYSNGMNMITVPSAAQSLFVNNPQQSRLRVEQSVTGAAAWSTSFLQPPPKSSPSSDSSSTSSDFPLSKPKASNATANNSSSISINRSSRGKKGAGAGEAGVEIGMRRCTHCASEKTPQWRTGPLGPKTLCNACGVRYKSGRLVPEYRPAASPTFVLTQHSNSHRKVIELRRQKELLLINNEAAISSAATARPELLFNDCGLC